MMRTLPIAFASLLWAQSADAEPVSRELIGRQWEVVSAEEVREDGSRGPSALYGERGIRMLWFEPASDRMIVILSGRNADGGISAYTGRYQLNEGEGSLVYDSVFSEVPNDAGDRLKRYVTIAEDRMTMRTPRPRKGVAEDIVLFHVWKKK